MGKVECFYNCVILRGGELKREDLWVQDGRIIDPETVHYVADFSWQCDSAIISPGFIDLKLNGGFGVDFMELEGFAEGLSKVRKELPSVGVTSFCPCVVTSDPTFYHRVISQVSIDAGSALRGAGILGLHLDGPFLNPVMKGAHLANLIVSDLSAGMKKVEEVYGTDFENVKIVTMAPELPGALEVIRQFSRWGIRVSLGHSRASIDKGVEAVNAGAVMISHLFNAMPAFHHRDPSLVGLVVSDEACGKQVKFGLIADGHHVHPVALRMAYRIAPKGLMLVSDAIAPMGLGEGEYKIGGEDVVVEGKPLVAKLKDKDVLFGSVQPICEGIKRLHDECDCSLVFALEAATKSPAEVMGLAGKKGTLDFGADADFVILIPESLKVRSTFIGGKMVFGETLK